MPRPAPTVGKSCSMRGGETCNAPEIRGALRPAARPSYFSPGSSSASGGKAAIATISSNVHST